MVIARTLPTLEFGDDLLLNKVLGCEADEAVTKFDKASVGFLVQFET